MVTLAFTRNCCGDRNIALDILVGNEKPAGNPLDQTNFSLCTHFAHLQQPMDIHGFTCDRLTVGRYVVIKNRDTTEVSTYNVVTVHGWPINIFK